MPRVRKPSWHNVFVVMFVAVVVVLVGAVLTLAWASDRRDRRSGHSRVRSDREMWGSARSARRSARWRRAQLEREVFPPKDLDEGR